MESEECRDGRKKTRATWIVVLTALPLVFVFTLLAWVMFSDVGTIRQEIAQAKSLPAYAQVQPGGHGFVEGILCPDEKPTERDLVIFCREEEELHGRTREYRCYDHVAPSVLIDNGDASIRVKNTGYTLRNPPVIYQDSPCPKDKQPRRIRGMRAGSPVFILGEIVQDGNDPQIYANIFFAGDRTAFLEDARNRLNSAFGFGILATVLALVVSVGGIFYLRYCYQHPEELNG